MEEQSIHWVYTHTQRKRQVDFRQWCLTECHDWPTWQPYWSTAQRTPRFQRICGHFWVGVEQLLLPLGFSSVLLFWMLLSEVKITFLQKLLPSQCLPKIAWEILQGPLALGMPLSVWNPSLEWDTGGTETWSWALFSKACLPEPLLPRPRNLSPVDRWGGREGTLRSWSLWLPCCAPSVLITAYVPVLIGSCSYSILSTCNAAPTPTLLHLPPLINL